MKKSVTRVLALLLVAVMAVGMLTACGSKEESKETNTKVESTDNKGAEGENAENTETAEGGINWDEHVEYDIWLYSTQYDFYADYSENPVVQYLNHKFNETLKFEQPAAGTETEQLSLMLGTGNYADMIEISYYTGSISTLHEDGVVIDLTELVEENMPNLMALVEKEPEFKKALYNDEGKIFVLPYFSEDLALDWGGLVYRHDILETMTGGYVAFPSGNDRPTTIEDWEYMLPLMTMYFQAAGMPEYAGLILPYNGYFSTGELIGGFGTSGSFFLDGDEVKYGPYTDEFYNYLKKMNEWYEAGYIYADFASRTNDVFYLPNTSLTYGAAAGIWYGLSSQLNDAMSMPDYGLFVDVHGLASPLDTEHGITSAPVKMTNSRTNAGGYVITSACENVERLLQTLDYLYSEEAGVMLTAGLNAEQVQEAQISLYLDHGVETAYTVEEDGSYLRAEVFDTDGALTANFEEFFGNRLPGYRMTVGQRKTETQLKIEEEIGVWNTYGMDGNLPNGLTRTSEEDKIFSDSYTMYQDYVDSMVPKFIMGSEELNDETWAAYKAQLEAYGIKEALEIYQASYERYKNR